MTAPTAVTARWAPPPRIRPLAVGVFKRGDRWLVMEGEDLLAGEVFYRPFGGGIEFGERGEDTVRRELAEELGATVGALRFLGTIENLYSFEGTPGHEIILVYSGELTGPAVLDQDRFQVEESLADGMTVCTGAWVPVAEFAEGRAILYPPGLREMVEAAT